MYKLILLIGYILLGHQSLMAQQFFSKTYDLEENVWVRGREIDLYGNHIYILTGKVCFNPERECGDIVKMDLQGNIIWKKEIGEFDIGNTNSLWIVNDTITITGHRNQANQPIALFMQQLDLNGDSITSHVFPMDTNLTDGVLNHGTYYFHGLWYLYGASLGNDATVDGLIIKTDSDGEIWNTSIWDDNFIEVQAADMLQRTNGDLILLTEVKEPGKIDTKRYVIQLNENLDKEYLWNSPLAANLGVPNNLISLKDNRLAVLAPNTLLGLANEAPFIHFINDNNEEYQLYEFDFQIGVDIKRFTSNLVAAKNGDLVGVGHYEGFTSKEMGYIYRISADGEFVWETTFRSQDWNTNDQLENNLNDIIELEDGSLVAVGWQDETTNDQSLRDLWVVRVSADGCLYEDNCGFGQFTTSTFDNNSNDLEINIVPNPASSNLLIQITNMDEKSFDLELLDLNGMTILQKKISGSSHKLDISDLISGLYFCRLINSQGEVVVVHKIYKE